METNDDGLHDDSKGNYKSSISTTRVQEQRVRRSKMIEAFHCSCASPGGSTSLDQVYCGYNVRSLLLMWCHCRRLEDIRRLFGAL